MAKMKAPKLKAAPILVKVAPDVYAAIRAIADAFKPDSPGGRKITIGELVVIADDLAGIHSVLTDSIRGTLKALK